MTTKSIALSILCVGTVVGVAAGGYFFMQPKNIGEILQSEGTKLLDINGNEKEWTIIASKHTGTNVTVTPASGNPITIKPINELNNITIKPDKGVADLKSKCQELFKKSKNQKMIHIKKIQKIDVPLILPCLKIILGLPQRT